MASTIAEEPVELPLLEYSQNEDKWLPMRSNSLEDSSSKMPHHLAHHIRLSTWNVWFQESHLIKERTIAIAEELLRDDALQNDVVCLQEVTIHSFGVLLECVQARSSWLITDFYKQAQHLQGTWYTHLILVRKDFLRSFGRKTVPKVSSFAFNNSTMQRGISVLDVVVDGNMKLRVGTAHLESVRSNSVPRSLEG